MLAPMATEATYTLPYDMAMSPRSFLPVGLPPLAKRATAPRWVDLEAWPPVLEYTSVSSTSRLMSRPLASTWSRPPKPMS